MTRHPDPKNKRKKRVMKELEIAHVAVVDYMAQVPARVAILKRSGDTVAKVLPKPNKGEKRSDFVSRFMSNVSMKAEFPDTDQRLAVAGRQFGKRLALTSSEAGHSHLIVSLDASEFGLAERKAGQTSFVASEGADMSHAHAWIMDDNGNISIGDADGHSHTIAVVVEKTDDTVLTHLEGDVFASFLNDGIPANTEAADGGTQENLMTPEEKAAFEKAADDKVKAAEKRAERADSVVSLSPDQREHFDTLKSVPEQDEWLAKTSDERTRVIKNLRDADPIVYTAEDGREFRKSADSDFVAEVKRNDELQKKLVAGESIRKREGYEKRAGQELAHLTGDVPAKADLLEAVDSLPDERREPVMKILKSKDAGMAKAFERVGTKDGGGEGENPEATIDSIAKRIREQDANLTEAQAYDKALETPEGQRAFEESRS